MLRTFCSRVAVFGSALIALSLVGSLQATANTTDRRIDPVTTAELQRQYDAGKRLLLAGDYLQARQTFFTTAVRAQRAGLPHLANESMVNAGVAAMSRQDTRRALPDLLKALDMARNQHDPKLFGIVRNDLAGVYLASGQAEAARQIALEGLADHAIDAGIRAKLDVQLAEALSRLDHFSDAIPFYWEAVNGLTDQGDIRTAVRVLALFGGAAIEAGRPDLAETPLDHAQWLIRTNRLPDSANVLRFLARVRARGGDQQSAAVLFNEALEAPLLSTTPRWMVYADRGEFRLSINDLKGALADFEEARRLIALLRSDIVPADADRVARESGRLSRVPAGVVEAGNRLLRETGERRYLQETFEAAEQNRMWSLRALVPSNNDWRSRLPENYWDLLARYQAAEAAFLEHHSESMRARAASLALNLQRLEAEAQSDEPPVDSERASPVLAEAQKALEPETVLFSFLVTANGGWLWAVDRNHADVYPIPAAPTLKNEIDSFVRELRRHAPDAASLGQELFTQLFGSVPQSYTAKKKWLLELDGPLYDLPFAALPAGRDSQGPVFLAARAALQAIPGVLLSRSPDQNSNTGGMLAIGDAVYNAADDRFPRAAASRLDARRMAALPRLPATAEEVRACSRAWGPADSYVLTGPAADLTSVERAIQTFHPSVIHFATHVVPGPDQYSSGMIALSLAPSGALGLLGPAEIQARTVTAALVVLNGCYSDRGTALPASGLMGLTRAWIGAGAGAVLATRWDIPDDAGKTLMADFYRALRTDWKSGPAAALQKAELALLDKHDPGSSAALLGSYFLLGRI